MNLDEILKPYECTSEHDCTHKEELARTKQALKALLTEARIDELNEIDIHYWGDDDTDVYMNEVLEPYLAERRAQLKNERSNK